jgi:phosphatidylserine/phosphatidylglycerophosphate/cardiolipin synthase-like enzyme
MINKKRILFLTLVFLIFLSILIFLSSISSAEILINELMYNPKPNDNYNEWIELFNPTNQNINLSNWIIKDNSAEDYLKGDFDNGNGTTVIPAKGYAIIADVGTKIYENFTIPNETIKLIVDDKSIGNGLGNSNDKLILKNIMGAEIDSIEWGIDFLDIPGLPIDPVKEGSSLSRYHNIDTDNTSNDFYEGIIPTPGSENIFLHKPNLDITYYPLYIPKIQNNSDCSIPFAIKVNISYFKSYESLKLKTHVVGSYHSNWPASQTWNGNSWEYSNYYTSEITTDENGNWSGWQFIRLKDSYQEYENNIKEKNSAFLKVKISNENITEETSKKVYLLDMDNSTSNGTLGGIVVGIAVKNNEFLEERITIVENKSGIITGIYITENNEIFDNPVSVPGYYKLTSPVDSNYKLKILDTDERLLQKINDVEVRPGRYGVKIISNLTDYCVRKNEVLKINLNVKNIGEFNDSIYLNIDNIPEGWNAILEKENLNLNPKDEVNSILKVRPYREYGLVTGTIKITAKSDNDVCETDQIEINLEVLAPDLFIKNIKTYNEVKEEGNIFGQGEIVKIKAFFKNSGNENATDTKVNFYYDSINDENLIGSKTYDSIGKYQKYPQIIWDTSGVSLGYHKIIVVADKDDLIDELNDYNNKLSCYVKIFDTSPTNTSKKILINEIYYHSRPGLFNEFISISNPTSEDLNISGWYLTNEPFQIKTEQRKIIFPKNTLIKANSKLVLSEKASTYKWEIGKYPDFEYNYDSNESVNQMNSSKKFIMSNKGAFIALKNNYNHTVDFVTYGNFNYSNRFWKGLSIPFSGEGVKLVRNNDKFGNPIDTNTSFDWINSRRYGIGQSNYTYVNFSINGEIVTFASPDCSYKTIETELKKANESIYLNIYEFTSPFLCDELIKALLRKVSVNIFLEGSPIGGISDEEKFILKRIANYGGDIRFIVSEPEKDVYSRYIFNHGKYLVIDNKTVIIESCNWAKTGVPKNPTYGNREWGVILRNKEIADYFLNVFKNDWDEDRCDIYTLDEMNLSISQDYFIDESIYWGKYEPEFKSQTIKGNFTVFPVLSPDTSNIAISKLIESSIDSIYIEQLYIYRDWDNQINPFVKRLVNKAKNGVDVKIILNYNPTYENTNEKINCTKIYFEDNDIEVKLIYTNWSYFTNVHNKGLIVDNKSVLISSINWNENSVMRNREIGIIINDCEVANYYKNIFFYDWNLSAPNIQEQKDETVEADHKNTIYIITIYTLTFALIARDWRKRQWT